MLKCTPGAGYAGANANFRLFANTSLSPLPGQDCMEGLCGKHIFFIFQLKFCRPSLPIPNGEDRCSVSEGTLISLLLALEVSTWEQQVASVKRCFGQTETQKTETWSDMLVSGNIQIAKVPNKISGLSENSKTNFAYQNFWWRLLVTAV